MGKASKPTFRFPYWLTDGLVLLAVSLFVLFPGTEGYRNLQHAKFVLFLVLFGGYLILMLLFSAELMLVRHVRPPSPRTLWKRAGPARKCIVGFWAASVLSAAFSPFGAQTLLGMSRQEGLVTITIYCGVFLCVSAFARPKFWWALVFGGSMMVFDVICLLQMQGFNPLGLYPEGCTFLDANIKYGGVYLGTTGNADLTAALLCLAIPLFWILILRRKERLRWTLLLPLALSLAVLIGMDVQAGLVAVILGTVLTIPAVLPVSRRGRIWLWAGAAAVLAAGLVLVLLSKSTAGTVFELREILRGNWDPNFGSGRIYIWREVLRRVPDRLLLGTGPDTMAAALIPGYVHIDAVTGEAMQFYVDVAHNEYLNILYHQGLLALIPYLGALIISAVRWLRCSRKDGTAAALGGAVLCYGIQAMFGFSMCQTAGLFWIAWGLLEGTCSRTEG